MRLVFVVIFVVFLMAYPASATTVSTDYTLVLQDNSLQETIRMDISQVTSSISRVTYELNDDFTVKSAANCDCSIRSRTLTCDLTSQVDVGGSTSITVTMLLDDIRGRGYVTGTENGELFRFKIAPQILSDMSIKVVLPTRSTLVKWGQEPVIYPSDGVVGTDGQNITVSWDMPAASPGSAVNLLVEYSPPYDSSVFIPLIAAVSVVLIAGIALALQHKKSMRYEIVTKLLREDEQIIVDMLKDAGGAMRQKEIEAKTGFSGPKVSKLVRRLEQDGVVEKIPKGRENIVTLQI